MPAGWERPSLRRRRLLQWGMTLPALPLIGGAASPPPFDTPPRLLIAGPESADLQNWARKIAHVLDNAMSGASVTQLETVGGADGVTAANRFDARIAPDGQTALLITGAAPLAWLAGDPRAQFDPARWVPVLAGQTQCILLLRQGATPPFRLPGDTLMGPELAVALGLDITGRPSVMVPAVGDAISAMAQGQIDAVLLRGPGAVTQAMRALEPGPTGPWAQAFNLSSMAAAEPGRAMPPIPADLPSLADEIQAKVAGADLMTLQQGWRAVTAAAQLEFALVLPALTPASIVSWWRTTLSPLTAEPDTTPGLTLLSYPRDGGLLARLSLDADASLRLRQWILERGKTGGR